MNRILPAKRLTEAQLKPLLWAYQFGYTTAEQLARVAGWQCKTNRQALARRLARAGWVSGVNTGHCGTVFTLTQPALDALTPFVPVELPYPFFDPTAIRLNTVRHDLAVQNLVLNLLPKMPAGTAVESARVHELQRATIPKIPDAVFVRPDGSRVAIELELTQKFDKHLERFMSGVLACLRAPRRPFGTVLVYSPSAALLDNYERHWHAEKLVFGRTDSATKKHVTQSTVLTADERQFLQFRGVERAVCLI